MMAFGLPGAAKRDLLARLGHRRAAQDGAPGPRGGGGERLTLGNPVLRDEMDMIRAAGRLLGLADPYFRCHDGIAGARTVIGGASYDNFVSYNYLGLNGDPRVVAAAQQAIARYGTSVSASRLVSGERPPHAALESALAALHGTEDCLVLTSGHATNVTVIGHLLDAEDLILHDALSHNSIVQGALLSGARRLAFAHNDPDDLERQLGRERGHCKRALVVIEGHYSMDGDSPDLARFAAVAARHGAWLMVDEAHSLGVLGATGSGIAEDCGVDPSVVDIWMGTLSKTLCSCGGYIAASAEIVRYLRYSAPGFVYSVGLSPPLAAAALTCLQLMREEPERIGRLRANAALFLEQARASRLDTGLSRGAAIVPVIIGSSVRAARVAQSLFEAGINVQPILYPAVPERGARLRFFLSSEHEPEQIRRAVEQTGRALEMHTEAVNLEALAQQFGR
jgi:8-amino-7-oxononanoate synthase